MPSIIDPVHDVVNLFTRHDVAAGAGVLRQITIRIPIDRLAMLDAMADYAECSRAVMANQVLGAGISAVMRELPEVVAQEVMDGAAERMQAVGGEG